MPDYTPPPWPLRGPRPPLAPITTARIYGRVLGQETSETVPALLDSGADYTEIPEEIARRLLRRSGDKAVVRGRFFEIQVIATEGFRVERQGDRDQAWALIGRDILNEAIILDGPRAVYEVR